MATADGDGTEIIDLREPTEVCVIGNGQAGLAVAARLIERGLTVTLLGSRTDGPSKADNHLDDQVGLFDREDLAPRPWVAGSGWPIEFDDLEPWLLRACDRYGVGDLTSDPLRTSPSQGDALPTSFWTDFDATTLASSNSFEFRLRLIEELKASPLCRVETDATVVELIRAPRSGAITSARYRTASSTGVTEAPRFVLACGAIENARLLLASDRGNGGIGNEHGNVGRYFMNHPVFSIGHVDVDDADALTAAALSTSAALSEELEVVRIALTFVPRPERPTGLVGSLTRRIRRARHPRAATLDVVVRCEQPPLIDSRVSLAYDIDAHGSPLPRIDWRIGEQVRTSVLAVQRRLADHIEQSGLGTYVPSTGSFDALGMPRTMATHLGTTRMSDRPKDGVVDRNSKVHHVPNLFVAGGSVFPTSGSMNPTLTLIALAERLADHIATTVGHSSISPQTGALPD